MKCHRIYFEPKKYVDSVKLLKDHFTGATITHGQGLWDHNLETVCIFEIHGDIDGLRLAAFAENLRGLNGQEAVRITTHDIDVQDITCPV